MNGLRTLFSIDNSDRTNTISIRDIAWAQTQRIPSWVRGREIGLDQYYTLPDIAEKCYESFIKFLSKRNVNIDQYTFIEPSVGTGVFYDLIKHKSKIGIDVETHNDEFILHDFLTWTPSKKNQKYIAIGNPPFGYRGWLALAFLNKSAELCDYVGFILPMSFQSEGKGSPKNRVKGMKLVLSEKLTGEVFVKPNGEKIKLNVLWQIWEKGEAETKIDLSEVDKYVEIFTIDKRKERLCGAEKMKECKYFLQRTYYGSPPIIVSSFDQVKYGCGYGIIIKENEQFILSILRNTNWVSYSNLAVHNCRHISMYHIKQAIMESL